MAPRKPTNQAEPHTETQFCPTPTPHAYARGPCVYYESCTTWYVARAWPHIGWLSNLEFKGCPRKTRNPERLSRWENPTRSGIRRKEKRHMKLSGISRHRHNPGALQPQAMPQTAMQPTHCPSTPHHLPAAAPGAGGGKQSPGAASPSPGPPRGRMCTCVWGTDWPASRPSWRPIVAPVQP
jgi:hypothetical protein